MIPFLGGAAAGMMFAIAMLMVFVKSNAPGASDLMGWYLAAFCAIAIFILVYAMGVQEARG